MEQIAQQQGKCGVGVFDQEPDLIGYLGSSGSKDDAELTEKAPGGVDSNLKNGFCQIDSDGRILHGGFLLLGFGRTFLDHFVIASDQEESISSLQPPSRARR